MALEQPQHVHLCGLPAAPSLQARNNAVNSEEQQLRSGAKAAVSGTCETEILPLLTAYSKLPSHKAWLDKNIISKLENRCESAGQRFHTCAS